MIAKYIIIVLNNEKLSNMIEFDSRKQAVSFLKSAQESNSNEDHVLCKVISSNNGIIEEFNYNSILIDCEKMKSFLEHNQLVQASAMNQKIENIIQDFIIENNNIESDQNKYWGAMRESNITKSYIQSGKTAEALESVKKLILNIIQMTEKSGNRIKNNE